jgi:hypothetical protein
MKQVPVNIIFCAALTCLMSAAAIAASPAHELRPTVNDHDLGLGYSVAIDGSTMVVGAPYYDGPGINRGRVYVFTWDGAGWSQSALLTPGGLDDNAYFGWDVDIDGSTILIGAPGEPDDDDGSHVVGAVFFYSGGGGDWNFQQRIHPVENVDFFDDDPEDFFQYHIRDFGRAVSLDGTFAAVGSSLTHDLNALVRDGAAWILNGSSGPWHFDQLIDTMDTNQTNRAEFGSALDLDNGVLVVGAPNYYANGDPNDARGLAQIFEHNGGSTFVYQQNLSDSLGDSGDAFGEAVAIDGTTIVVGNSEDDLLGNEAGSAMVFFDTGATWAYETTLTSCDGIDEIKQLGRSVDVDGDAVVAGGTSLSVFEDPASSVVVWRNITVGDWRMIGRHEASQVNSDANLGTSVAIDQGRVVSGAPDADRTIGITWIDIGAVFVWDMLSDDRDLNGTEDWYQLLSESHDWNGNCVPDEADCLADWSSSSHSQPDGHVDSDDLLDLIDYWGSDVGNGSASQADLNEDSDVGIVDLLWVLTDWGTCP